MAKNSRPSIDEGLPPEIKRLIRTYQTLRDVSPWLTQAMQEEDFQFRGLSVFLSDKGGFGASLRTYRVDGQPVVGYTNGVSPLDAFLGLETVILLDKFYPDRKNPEYDPTKEKKG